MPPFDRIRPEHFGPAFEAALAERRRELAAIRAAPGPAGFADTVEALERSGATFRRVESMFAVWSSSLKDEAFRAVEREWAPRLAAASDEVLLDPELFARLDALWEARDELELGAEPRRLLWRQHDRFVRRGARLEPAAKERLAAINQRLAALQAEFGQRVQAEENTWTVLEGREDLAGLPASMAAALGAAAAERGLPGRWAVLNTRSAVDPFLTFSTRRDLRERIWRTFKERGDRGGAGDTNALIAEIVPLRAEKARLLGHATYADWKLADTMAGTPQRARALMETVWERAVARAREDAARLQSLASREHPGLVLEPWDYLHYAERLRREEGGLDQGELEPYLTLDSMIEASFWMAGRLYGTTFHEVTATMPVPHAEARVWEVMAGDGSSRGLFYGDYFARPDKSSGAWELAYREQSRLDGGGVALVSNNNNFVKGRAGEPVPISLDDARVLFHELGHALHDLLSDVTYRSLAGTSTATDFVELPSQVHEQWLLTPELLDRFARHRVTGEPMPPALRERVAASRLADQGYMTSEYLACALLDLELHSVPGGRVDPRAFEREALARIGMPRAVGPRHRLAHFGHLFGGDAYAAGYYSYLWSATMAADAWEAFVEYGDPWSPEVARRLEALLAAGDSVDPAALWRAFRGREPEVAALLRQRGL